MDLPTYTDVWAVERRLYKIEDWVLPAPVSLLQAGVFAATAALWWGTLIVLGVGFSAQTGWLFLLPPAGAAWAAGRPVAEYKRPHEMARSWLRFLCAPKVLTRLRPAPSRARQPVRMGLWRPAGAHHNTSGAR